MFVFFVQFPSSSKYSSYEPHLNPFGCTTLEQEYFCTAPPESFLRLIFANDNPGHGALGLHFKLATASFVTVPLTSETRTSPIWNLDVLQSPAWPPSRKCVHWLIWKAPCALVTVTSLMVTFRIYPSPPPPPFGGTPLLTPVHVLTYAGHCVP